MTPEHNDVAETSTIERIARLLASWTASVNAEGTSPSAGAEVDQDWPDHIDEAVAILKIIREPDAAMAALGDTTNWRRMIEAAILGRARIDLPRAGSSAVVPDVQPVRDAGTASHSHDGAWTRRDERLDESFPASDPTPVNPGVD